MLIEFKAGLKVESFQELFKITKKMIEEIPKQYTLTTVLGPVTSEDPEVFTENLDRLHYKSKQLSEKGWAVLDLTSYQLVYEKLIEKMNIKGYPHIILDDFMDPLLRSGLFKIIFVRENYRQSFGTSLEHDIALGSDIHIEYFP